MQSRQKNNLIWTNSIPRFLIRNRSPIHEDKSGLNKSIHEVNNLVKAEGQSNKPECSGQLCMYLMARTVICACCVFTWMRHAVFAFGVFKSLHVWRQHYCDFTVLPVKSFSVKFFPTKLGKLFFFYRAGFVYKGIVMLKQEKGPSPNTVSTLLCQISLYAVAINKKYTSFTLKVSLLLILLSHRGGNLSLDLQSTNL